MTKSGHTVGGMKNLRIDRIIPEVGRLAISSGTTDKKQFALINACIDDLAAKGLVDDLLALKDKATTPQQLVKDWKANKLKGPEYRKHSVALIPAMRDWLKKKKMSEVGKGVYESRIDQLTKYCTDATEAKELPTVLASMLDVLLEKDQLQAARITRTVCLSFARKQFGPESTIRKEISAIEEPKIRDSDRQEHNPLSVGELFALADLITPKYRDMLLTMALTGMHWKEYTVDGFTYADGDDFIAVHGQKTDNRERKVPVVFPPAAPYRHMSGVKAGEIVSEKSFTNALKHANALRKGYTESSPEILKQLAAAAKIPTSARKKPDSRKQLPDPITIRDLRRTYAVILGACIPHARVQQYMGHRKPDQTAVYQDVAIKTILADADTIVDFIEHERERAKNPQPVKPRRTIQY